MKVWRWILLLVAAYEAAVGASELLWVSTGSKTLASVAALPSAASVADSTIAANYPSAAHYIEGGLDLAIAGLIAVYCFKK